MKRKCFLIALLILVLFSFQGVFAEVDYTEEADMLNSLGLFNGTESGYELNRVPTRVEAAAMLVRLLGGEKEANEMKYEHPFTDVPDWANNIVGYMYEKGYTTGIGNNLFGSNQVTIARDYTTFMLRSLGYSSSSDFNYLEAIDYAVSQGIITQDDAASLNSIEFKRNEMVLLSYRTLNSKLKESENKLIDKLFDSGSINKPEEIKQDSISDSETVLSGIDSSLEKLEVNSPAIYIYAEKKEIGTGKITGFDLVDKEDFIEGYSGSICFKKGFSNWVGSNIKYEISFYNEGKLLKEIEYVEFNYEGENDGWTEFITPYDKFDELKIAAYPISDEEINNDLDGILEIITTDDSEMLKETILKYGNVHAKSGRDSRYDFSAAEVTNAFAWKTIFEGSSTYYDGIVYRPKANKYIVDKDFTLQFTDEGSRIGTDNSKGKIGLPKNDFKEGINLILIFDDGYKTMKAFLVK